MLTVLTAHILDGKHVANATWRYVSLTAAKWTSAAAA